MAIDYEASLRADATEIAAVARSTPLDAPVPSCPGWDLGTLVAHVGRVHRWAAEAMTGGGEPPARFPKAPPDLDGLADWYEESAGIVAGAIATTPPAAPAWNFANQPAEAAFWPRRQAIETTVHRWDAQAAAGTPAPIDAELAVDGIDELLVVMVPVALGGKDGIDIGGSLHVHCTDGEGEWTLHTDDGVYRVERGHAKGDAALRGPASQLLLALWGRVPLDAEGLELFGDTAVIDRWRELPRL